MVLMMGSKSENPNLTGLVSKNYRNLNKYYKTDAINAMQSWLSKQPHLPILTDDQVLVFLNASNYSGERAKEILDSYYTIRTRAPEIFSNRNPNKDLARAFTIAYFVILPESAKSHDGNQVVVFKLKDTDPAKANFVEGVKTTFAVVDLFTGKFPLTKGVEFVMDMEGLVFGHLARIDFSALRVFVSFCQEAMPFQLKALHVINTFSLINQIMALIKPLLNTEFFNKIKFHSPDDFNKFTSKHVPLSSLPSDYGGMLKSMDEYQDEIFRQFQVATEWIEEIENCKVDESKRLGRRRSDLNHCDGSFKKLELD